MRALATTLTGVLAAVYPLAIWWALTHWSARSVGWISIAVAVPLLALRLRRVGGGWTRLDWTVLRLPLLILALMVGTAVLDDPRFILALPVVLNGALLASFASTLFGGGPSMIERFARLVEPELSPAKARHCRQATVAWCAFFAVNGAVALGLGLFATPAAWAIYNGGLAYLLIGVMFVAEFVVRRVRFRDYGPGPHDRLLRLLLPAAELTDDPPPPRQASGP